MMEQENQRAVVKLDYVLIVSFMLSGRVRYMFASFWNRNHTLRALQRALKNFHAMLEAEKKVLPFPPTLSSYL